MTTTVIVVAAAASIAYSRLPQVERWFVDSPEKVADGELWRLVTTTLVHGGVLHALFNLFWLYRFGPSLEGWMGPARYTGYLLALAAGSSGASLFLEGPAIGLSGIVYGLLGTLWALRKRKDFAAELLSPQVLQVLLIWLVICAATGGSFGANIANVAHISGLALGWTLGAATLDRRRIWWIAIWVAVVVGLAVLPLLAPAPPPPPVIMDLPL